MQGLSIIENAIVATHCHTCGNSYWSWLDAIGMSSLQDVINATRTKECNESELRLIVDEMVRKAEITGVRKEQIKITLRTIGAVPAKSVWKEISKFLLLAPFGLISYFAIVGGIIGTLASIFGGVENAVIQLLISVAAFGGGIFGVILTNWIEKRLGK